MIALYPAAVKAAQLLDQEMRSSLPNEIVNCIELHSGLAVASALIPIGGLDVVAMTTNIWTMYMRINNKLGISFSKNMMKSIVSAVAANLTSNLAVAGVGALVKLIPGAGTVVGGVMMSATMYGSTLAAGWIYLTAIVNWVKKGKGSGDDLKSCINDVIAQNKDEIDKLRTTKK